MKEQIALETGYRSTTAGSLVATADGRVLWITCGPDFGDDVPWLMRAEIRESADCGRNWGPPLALAPRQGGSMARLASGALLCIGTWFGGYDPKHPDKTINEGYTQQSSDGGRTWSPPTRIECAERYLSPGTGPVQLSSGRVVFPFGYLEAPGSDKFVISAIYSDDEGITWHRSTSVLDVGGAGFESGGSEPSVAELPDGRVWMLIRTQTGFLWESFSSDGGATWEPPRASALPSSSSGMALLRTSGGRIIVVWNNSVWRVPARESLALAYTDDGHTFRGFREIAHTDYPIASRPGDYWYATNPSVCEAPDGTILVGYNYGNWNYMTPKLARVDDAWITESSLLEDFQLGRSAWPHIGSGDGRLLPPEDDEPGASLELAHRAPRPCGSVRNFPLVQRGSIRVTATVLKPDAFLLLHNSYLVSGRYDEACLRVRFAADGTFIAAGTPVTKVANEPTTNYRYHAFPIEREVPYPVPVPFGQRFVLTIRCDVSRQDASFTIDDAPAVSVTLREILGLCYFGAAADNGGAIRLRKIETADEREGQ